MSQVRRRMDAQVAITLGIVTWPESADTIRIKMEGPRVRLGIGFVAAGVVVANSGLAQHVDRHGFIPGLSPPSGPVVWRPASRSAMADEVARLQPSMALGKSLPAMRGRLAAGSARDSATDIGETPELRLEPSLRANVPVAGTGARTALPSGDLNPGGLVRASRMRIRDGAVFLEGEGRVQSAVSLPDMTSANAASPGKAAQAGRQD